MKKLVTIFCFCCFMLAACTQPSEDSTDLNSDNYLVNSHVQETFAESSRKKSLGTPYIESSSKMIDISNFYSTGSKSMNVSQYADIMSYGEDVDDGVRLMFLKSNFESGRLFYTVNSVELISHLDQLNTKINGFTTEACGIWDDENAQWLQSDMPGCIHTDGSFQDGCSLMLVHITVESDNAALDTQSSENSDNPYLFNASSLLVLTDLSQPIGKHYLSFYADYFSGLNDYSEHEYAFYLEPGNSTELTLGFIIGREEFDKKADLASLRLSNGTIIINPNIDGG